MSTHLLDEEKYIEDGYIDTSYFGGLIDGQLQATGYFVDLYIDETYFDNVGIVSSLTADLTFAIQDLSATLSSSFTQTADATLLVLADASISSAASLSADGIKLGSIASSISSAATISITGTNIKGADADISVNTTQTTNNTRTRDDSASVNSEFTHSALVGAIRQGEVSITGAFSPTLTATFLRLGDIDLSSAFTHSATAQRYRDPNATTLANIINLSAQGDKLPGSVITVDIAATLEATLDPLLLAEADVSAIFAATVTGSVTRGFAASIEGSFNQGVDLGNGVDFGTNVEAIFPLEADLSVATNTSISGDRTRTADTDFQGVASQISVAGFLQSDIANLTVSFAQTTDVGVTYSVDSTVSISSTCTAEPSVSRDHSADLPAVATLQGAADALNGFSANLDSAFVVGHTDNDLGFNNDVIGNVVKEDSATLLVVSTTSVAVGEIEPGAATLNSEVSLSATGEVTKQAQASVVGTGGFSITILAIRVGETDLISTSTVSITGDRVRFASSVNNTIVAGCVTDPGFVTDSGAEIISRSTVTAVVGELILADDRTYVIPRENRVYAMPTENRTHTIIRENRIYTIKGAA